MTARRAALLRANLRRRKASPRPPAAKRPSPQPKSAPSKPTA